MAHLRRVSDKGAGETIELNQQYTTFGRAEGCDVVIEKYEDVSREHCGLRRYDDGVFTITDFGSRNGTYVNGERIYKETTLSHGDRLLICKAVEFLFSNTEQVEERLRSREDKEPETASTKMRKHRAKRDFSRSDMVRTVDEVGHELADTSYTRVMRKLVSQARPRQQQSLPPDKRQTRPLDEPNKYW